MPNKLLEIQATIEELTDWVPSWIPFYRIAIVRLYGPGIEPVEPNRFTFAVVAIIWKKTATIKALVDSVSSKYLHVGAAALKLKYKITSLKWRHHGIDHEYTIK
jgi:hypothetical protein